MSRAADDWWATFFEGSALDLWRRARSRDENRGEAADIVRSLHLAHGDRLLDVPCGSGRLALELAARNLRVCGLDASSECLADARRLAAERGVELELQRGDMRALPWHEEFDAALCAGNSFGFFDHHGNRAFLSSVFAALRPGGRFLLEYPLVAELVPRRERCRDWRIFGERILLSEAEYDEGRGRLETTYTFVDIAQPTHAFERRSASFQIYSADELEQLLAEIGFTRMERLGELDGSPFGPESALFYVRAMRS